MAIKIEKTPTQVIVYSPYNSLFVSGAKKLAGKFGGGGWSFDIRDEDRVTALCRRVYGSDGVTTETCTIRIEMPNGASEWQHGIEAHGYPIAKAFGRDSGAKVSEGIVVLEGGFGSGGSVKNWTTTASPGTVILIRDFPLKTAQKWTEEAPKGWIVTIEDERPPVDVAALEAERERLLSRLSEIDEMISSARPEVQPEAESA